jgi:hypothetical protein
MVAKAFDESRDCFVMSDSWDLETHIREASDVVAQRLTCSSRMRSRSYLLPG